MTQGANRDTYRHTTWVKGMRDDKFREFPHRLRVGTPAPDFTLPTPDGSMVCLSDLRGQHVVLEFGSIT